MSDVMLDIGCGENPAPGYQGWDAKDGLRASPLPHTEGRVSAIRASHVLEHYGHRQIEDVLREWHRVLAPGGDLRIAVPDFLAISRAYLNGARIPVQGYVMGGQIDTEDHHGAIFDDEALIETLEKVGFLCVGKWKSEQQDAASLPISLNVHAIKPYSIWPNTAAVISVPRLGLNDFWGHAFSALSQLRIPLTKFTGAFWEQCLTRGINEALQQDPEWLLTLDSDSVFTARDIRLLQTLAQKYSVDAITALQTHRRKPTPLLTIAGEDGKNVSQLPREAFELPLVRASTAHFGLTLIRVETLKKMPRPWFHGEPDPDGGWGEGRTDPDIHFWRAWKDSGHSLYIAPRCVIGHIETGIRWPDRDLGFIWQHPEDYREHGKPTDVWV